MSEVWSAYWPRFVRLDRGSRWRAPGDRARITLRILAREVDLEMTLARYRIVIEYIPRAGWRGLLDRTLVRHAITDTARETTRNLEARFREQRQPTDAPGRRCARGASPRPDGRRQ